MQIFFQQVSALPAQRSNSDKKFLSRITIQVALLAAVVAIPIACYSRRSAVVLMPSSDFGPVAPEIAGAFPGAGGQSIPIDQGGFRFNVDAFNYHRKMKSSLESAELVSLANALKLELARNPGKPPSPSALMKAEKIEKLARDVKNEMQQNPIDGPN